MNPPRRARMPPAIQAASIHSGAARRRATFPGLTKIPTPRMAPATTTVVSQSPSSRRKPGAAAITASPCFIVFSRAGRSRPGLALADLRGELRDPLFEHGEAAVVPDQTVGDLAPLRAVPLCGEPRHGLLARHVARH